MSMDQVQTACTDVRFEVKEKKYENKKKAELQRFNIVGSFMANSIKPVTVPTVKFHQEQIPSSITSRNTVVGGAPSNVPDPLTLAPVGYTTTVTSKTIRSGPLGVPGPSEFGENDYQKSKTPVEAPKGSGIPSGLSSYDPLNWNE